MKKEKQLQAIREYVNRLFQDDVTGHDFFHMKRVANMAKFIAEKENADVFICEAAGWIHDVGDHKLFSDPAKALMDLEIFLESINVSDEDLEKIRLATKDISFSKGKAPVSLEGKIVQDADGIDAIGAIGIARTFAYGGAKDQIIYHDVNKVSTSIQHFYDKLLKLKERMHTSTAKEIANKRHKFMESYLKQFFQEW